MNTAALLMITIGLWLVVTVCEQTEKYEQKKLNKEQQQRALVNN